jgi:hypothetical protein
MKSSYEYSKHAKSIDKRQITCSTHFELRDTAFNRFVTASKEKEIQNAHERMFTDILRKARLSYAVSALCHFDIGRIVFPVSVNVNKRDLQVLHHNNPPSLLEEYPRYMQAPETSTWEDQGPCDL